MQLKHVFYFLPFFFLLSCNDGAKKEIIRTQDSVKKARQLDSIAIEKAKNQYLIEPPDTNYSGDYLTKYDNGNVKFKGFFRFGKRHGEWMAFYANGILWSKCFYDKGLKHGLTYVNFESGKPRYKGYFKHDLRDSLWVFFDEFGTEVKRVMFKNDEEVPLPNTP